MNHRRTPNLAGISPGNQQALMRVCELVGQAGGRAWLVGGSVRDGVLGLAQLDMDLEVFGLEAGQLQEILSRHFELDLVGKSFGIIKLRGVPLDVGLPRKEIKTGVGHRDFAITTDPYLPLEKAAARRDFTINSIYYDPLADVIADPFGGLQDLLHGILRHTSGAFAEDPLRVLRGMQHVARFRLKPDPDTLALCRTINGEGLAPERIFQEWRKLLLLGEKPSLGLDFLHDSGWLDHFPELSALIGCPQDPVYHPEGDVWVHTLHCLDVFADERVGDPWEDLVVGLAVLCHDLGKPSTTEVGANGRIRSHRHESVGVEKATTFLGRMTDQTKLVRQVLPLVAEHMAPAQLERAGASDAAVRRLSQRVGRIDRLLRVARADALGRPPLGNNPFPGGPWLEGKARQLDVLEESPGPLVQGRDLLEMGWRPGPHLKDILQRIYRAQLDGKFVTANGGRDYAKRVFGKPES